MRIGQGRRDDKTHLLRAAHLVARELYSALRYRFRGRARGGRGCAGGGGGCGEEVRSESLG